TWAVLILPFLEQDTYYSQWDVSREYHLQPDAVRRTPVKTYFCPSRRTAATAPTASLSSDVPDTGRPTTEHTPGPLADYACCRGTRGHDYWWDEAAPCDGAFQYGTQRIRFDHIADGLSNTSSSARSTWNWAASATAATIARPTTATTAAPSAVPGRGWP